MKLISRGSAALLVACAVLSIGRAMPADAAGTATITTTITVLNVCAFTTTNYTTNFNYDPIIANNTTPPTTQAVALRYLCTFGATNDKFTFDGGKNASGSQRRALGTASTPDYINYGLYTDAANMVPIVPNTTSVAGQTGTGYITGTPLSTTIYVGVPAGQTTVGADTYTDVVTVSLNP